MPMRKDTTRRGCFVLQDGLTQRLHFFLGVHVVPVRPFHGVVGKRNLDGIRGGRVGSAQMLRIGGNELQTAVGLGRIAKLLREAHFRGLEARRVDVSQVVANHTLFRCQATKRCGQGLHGSIFYLKAGHGHLFLFMQILRVPAFAKAEHPLNVGLRFGVGWYTAVRIDGVGTGVVSC